ncbi:hypothetical protein [Microbispora sp. NPDC049633]|uniref:hypothetical protein n=1 Tax=Microbispora sp. NPDC049633 TaxID=3154355 RepID=UPI003442C551
MIPDDIFARRLKPSGVPAKYRALRLPQWKPYNGASEMALAAAKEFVESFPDRWAASSVPDFSELIGKGLALIGTPGAGKTTLTALTVMETARRHNVVFVFTTMSDYIGKLLEQISLSPMVNAGDPRAIDRYWKIDDFKRRMYNAPLAGVDDVGKEHHTASDFARDEVDKLLRARFRKGFPTVVNSNTPLAKWGDLYNPSMESFVQEAFTSVTLGGRDLRRAA